ncbi:MAG: hypothetical protein CVV52_04150 [Spirochaetae bacterium HGW-Spirochaetae-8]|nr:MAG: hypothetical protein CVV52_04150 [Spirochaetae bacterium HGW-Spirochaetae-8]
MKKFSILVLLLVLAGLVLTGCSQDYMRNLEIINDTENCIIDRIYINYNAIEPRKMGINALLDGHTIGPQERIAFKLGPYPEEIAISLRFYQLDPITGLPILNTYDVIEYNNANAYIEYLDIVAGRNKVIEATLVLDTTPDPDVYDIDLGGDGYLQSADSFSSQPPAW